MFMFMTTGTVHFLKKLTAAHPTINFYFMKSGASTLVLYESTKKKGVFVSGQTFHILRSHESINKKGFVTMDFIPVMEDTMPVFEERTITMLPKLEKSKGLIALRFLKQLKSNQYVILYQWQSERHYVDWKNSSDHDKTNILQLARLPAYFAERPFTQTYTMLKEDE